MRGPMDCISKSVLDRWDQHPDREHWKRVDYLCRNRCVHVRTGREEVQSVSFEHGMYI